MAKQSINLGTTANDNTGDSPRVAGDKINDNFTEIYGVSGILKSNGSTTLSAAVAGTDYAAPTSGTSLLYGNGSGGFSNATVGTGLSFSAGTLSSTVTGTVTSVGVTVPSFLSVSGSPVTSSGTIAISLATQTANTVFAGPTTGSAASPTFRALVLGDLPIGVGLTASTLAQFAATTSSQLAGVISDETGTGSLVFANTPTLITPVLGVATATSINKVAITAPATGATLTIPDGVTFTGPSSSGTAVIQGSATGSGLTMATARLLGRSTASTGAIEEISVGSGLTLSAGTLSASGGGSSTNTTLATAAGTATCTNTTTETTISPTVSGSLTIAANTAVQYETYRFVFRGHHSVVAGGATYTLKLYMGSTVIAQTSALFTAACTNRAWEVTVEAVVTTTGASGAVWAFGTNTRFTAASTVASAEMVGTTANSTTTIDFTADQAVTLKATYTAASASNIITCTHATMTRMKSA